MVEGQLYDWLMDNGYTSEENAHSLASLTQRSGTVVPDEMKRAGKLLNFFKDRSNIFGIVYGSNRERNPSIYARDFRQEYRGRPARGRGGLQTYVNRRDAARDADQAAADARLREYFAANAALEETERQRNSPWGTGYKWNEMLGGKSKSKSRSAKKSKSRSRSARKSRNKKNRNRRSKSKSRN
jgi:hypothetical protein